MSTLYRKYRPQAWADVSGQEHVKATLAYEVATGRVAHAYLFAGPRGIGKTTVARIMARAVNCERAGSAEAKGEPCGECPACRLIQSGQTLDIIEIDAASHRGIDAVREGIIESARFAPASLRRKVFIVDEVHMLTTEAFNALLKTLEEPPAHVVFMLATTELHKLPATIVSRCQRFDFRKIPFAAVTARLSAVAEAEGVRVDEATLAEIARASEGCLRDAESLLGQVLTLGEAGTVSIEEARTVLPRSDWRRLGEYVEGLVRRDVGRSLAAVADSLADGVEASEFAGGLVGMLRLITLTKTTGSAALVAPDADTARLEQLTAWAAAADLAWLVRATELVMERRLATRTAHPAQLPLELAAIQLAADLTAAPVPPPVVKLSAVQPERLKAGKRTAPSASRPSPAEPAAAPQTEPPDAHDESIEVALPDEGNAPGDASDAGTKPSAAPPAAQADQAMVPASAPAACSLEDLRASWQRFVKKTAEFHHGLPYLLATGELTEARGNVAVVSFGFAFHCDRFNTPKHKTSLEQALSEVVGQPMRLEAKLVAGMNSRAPEAVPAPQSAASAEHKELAAAFGGQVLN
jgi:DNA polymerase-3 subunit gamma/tau